MARDGWCRLRNRWYFLLILFVVVLSNLPTTLCAQTPTRLEISPKEITLDGWRASHSILVDGIDNDGRRFDLTRQASFKIVHEDRATVSLTGRVHGASDGTSEIIVSVGDLSTKIALTVRDSQQKRPLNFENDILPVLSRYGCNASGCHGKAEGQNGFKLSVFGFDPMADFIALTQEGRGRRLHPTIPANSLLLTKASGGVPHGGGVRIRRNSPPYRMLGEWIEAGTPFGDEADPKVASIEVQPRERSMRMKAQQQLRVIATYTDGRKVDVTNYAKFQSNNVGLASVDEFGLTTTLDVPGDVAVMASYMGAVDVFRVLIPGKRIEGLPSSPPRLNFVDALVDAKLEKLNIVPAQVCSDSDFLRRAHLDIIGTLPTAIEARRFLSSTDADRRAKLVDSLLQRSEFADYWALKWADLLRVDRLKLGHKQAYEYYRWIRDSFAANKPMNEFAAEVLTSNGPLSDAPSGHLFKVVANPGDLASTVSQVFLGIRIECARCHHHPYDRWSQTDYYGMQAFFTQVGFKKHPRGEILTATKNASTKHPRTGKQVFAHALTTANPETNPEGDRRKLLANWMIAPGNPWFAQNIANRTWAHFLGRGIIEPVDDVRLTNPPSNPALLKALTEEFIREGYDFKQLIRTITRSRTYQLSTKPNESNRRDEQNYSRALFRRMDAEVLLDAVCQTTGVPEKFDGMPHGYRAIQLWDSQVPNYFLKVFGRPARTSPCECERVTEPNVSQVLHVLNSPRVHSKLSHTAGQLARMAREVTDDQRLTEELYLTFFSRMPNDAERNQVLAFLKKQTDNRQQAVEDIAWSMLNTLEFLFNH